MLQYQGRLKPGVKLDDVITEVKLRCADDSVFEVEEQEDCFIVNVINSHPSYKVGNEFRKCDNIERFLCIAI